MRFLIISLVFFSTTLILSQSAQAQKINFTIKNNSIGFRQTKNFYLDKNFINLEDDPQHNFYLVHQNNNFLLREVFDPKQVVEIHSYHQVSLPKKEAIAALSFEYLLESDEDLIHFDNPVFYIVFKKEGLEEVIFAKTIRQSGFSWNKVILDLKRYNTRGASLIFYAGNLGDKEKASVIYLRSLSSQIIVLDSGDYLLIGDQEVKDLASHVEKKSIVSFDQNWPIYTFSNHLIDDLIAIRERDQSLTLSFLFPKEDFFKNSLWKLSCDGQSEQFISQNNFYLLPNLVFKDFWPNLNERVLINVQDFICKDLSLLSLEKF
jgi:hypothetical protein